MTPTNHASLEDCHEARNSGLAGEFRGTQSVRAFLSEMLGALPDFDIEVLDMVADDRQGHRHTDEPSGFRWTRRLVVPGIWSGSPHGGLEALEPLEDHTQRLQQLAFGRQLASLDRLLVLPHEQ